MRLVLRKFIASFGSLPRRRPLFWWTFGLTALMVALNWFLIIFRLRPIVSGRELIALHYNVYVGVDRVGSWSSILWWPIWGTVVMFLNTIGAIRWWNRQRLLAVFLLFSELIVALILLIAVVFVFLVNV